MTPNSFSFGVFDRILKQVLRLWKFGFQTEFSPGQLEKLTRRAGFTRTRSEAVLRNPLPHDNQAFRTIGFIDRVFSLLFTNWGFYSYVYATKESMP